MYVTVVVSREQDIIRKGDVLICVCNHATQLEVRVQVVPTIPQDVEDSPEIQEKIRAARLAAIRRWPYFSSQLLSMVLVPKPDVKTAATDCRGRFYYNPWFVKLCSVEVLATIWQHEGLHGWLDHAERRSGRDADRWNKSVDREINDDLAREGFPFPSDFPPALPIDIGQPDGMLGEQYYEFEKEQEEGNGDKPGGPGGSSSDGIPRPWEDGPEKESGTPELPKAVQEVIRQKVSMDIVEHQKSMGRVPAGLLEKAERDLAPPKVSWQKEMQAAVRACIADVAGAVDFTYRRPNRRQSINSEVIMPATRRPVPETAVVIDTSGSMYTPGTKGASDLDVAVSEVQGVIRGLGGKDVRVMSVDAMVHSMDKINRASKIEIRGGGGTDMRAGLKAAEKMRPRPDLCIILTDGYTPWPERKPKGISVIIGLIGRGQPVDTPSWARTIKIEN